VRFYLSSDATLDAGDVLLVTRTGGNLNPGASRTETVSLTIPADTAPGTYHVIAVTDPLGQLVEMDESNNIAVSAAMPITLYRPDLTPIAVTMPAGGATGRPLAITSSVRNLGPASAGPSTVRFYLSSDALLDAGDVLLGARAIGGLGAGATSTAVTSVVIPAGTTPGSYRIIAVVDALEQQTELDETNNTLVSETSVTITLYRPDLVLTTVSVPATGAAGRTLTVTNAVKNLGPAPAGPFAIRLYLSSDDTLDAGDVLLATRLVGGLPVGATSTAMTTVTIPAGTPVPSSYRVIGVVDALGQQTETEEGNNVTVSAPLSLTAGS
jgi:subtilase family serine protease